MTFFTNIETVDPFCAWPGHAYAAARAPPAAASLQYREGGKGWDKGLNT